MHMIWVGSSEVHTNAGRYCIPLPSTRGLARTLVLILLLLECLLQGLGMGWVVSTSLLLKVHGLKNFAIFLCS